MTADYKSMPLDALIAERDRIEEIIERKHREEARRETFRRVCVEAKRQGVTMRYLIDLCCPEGLVNGGSAR